MKKENLDDYELFYMEIPQADYLRDIEIQDEYEDDDTPGLSENQVNALAEDSLADCSEDHHHQSESRDTQTLFSEDSDTQQ